MESCVCRSSGDDYAREPRSLSAAVPSDRATSLGSKEIVANQMSTTELSELEKIEALISNGRQLGVLTYAEVAQAASEFDLDEADIEKLHRLLEEQGIELVEELELAVAADARGTLDADTRKAQVPL